MFSNLTIKFSRVQHCTILVHLRHHVAYMRTFRQHYIFLHCTNMRIICLHVTCVTPRGNDRLHYMCMPLTCWPLQALAEARTLAGGRRDTGPYKCLRWLERLWGAGTLLAMTTKVFRFACPPPRTLAKSSNLRGCRPRLK